MQTSNTWQQYSCLHPQIIQSLYSQSFQNPTSIQSQVFQNYKHYYDFLIASQTGSGKTLAFAAPVVSDLVGVWEKVGGIGGIGGIGGPLVLVLTPTRELALQIQEVFGFLVKDTNIRQTCILGGLSLAKQIRILHEQNPHIIIGTPGRIHQLLSSNQLHFQHLKYLIIDEADRMIEMGHYVELDEILNKIFEPKVKETFQDDFQEIQQRLRDGDQGEFYVMEKGKKKKIKFNISSIATQQLFQVPMDIFQVQGDLPIKEVTSDRKTSKKKKAKKQSENPEQELEPQPQKMQQENQQNLEFLNKLKRKIFFISATLTRQFKGTKYFIRKNRSDQPKSKSKSKNSQKDQKSKSKSKPNSKQPQQNQLIPKLKALLSRIKFDAKPKIIDQSSQIFLPAKLKQYFTYCQSDLDKITIILCYIKELPENSKIILFTNTIRASKRLKFFIQAAGLRAVTLHSHMMQKQRLEKLERFQKSKSNILISTDVAARGLDFMITDVIQYSVPINGDTYVHRVGRTARANRPGQALVLISQKQATRWQQITETIQSSDPTRKISKYTPLQSTYESTKQKVDEYEWIRLNQQKHENKRIEKLNQQQAQQFGVQPEEIVQPKRIKEFEEEERMRKQRIEKQIRVMKERDQRERTGSGGKGRQGAGKVEVGDGKVWKKNKLVMSLDQIKKFL